MLQPTWDEQLPAVGGSLAARLLRAAVSAAGLAGWRGRWRHGVACRAALGHKGQQRLAAALGPAVGPSEGNGAAGGSEAGGRAPVWGCVCAWGEGALWQGVA